MDILHSRRYIEEQHGLNVCHNRYVIIQDLRI